MEIYVQGLAPEQTEVVRDQAALFMAAVARRMNIDPARGRASLIFDSTNAKEVEARLSADSGNDSTQDSWLFAMLKTPRSNTHTLRLSGRAANALDLAIKRVNVRSKVYNEWNLKTVDPVPRLSLNFFGLPGTGKTLAAHYIAAQLSKSKIEVSYSDVVSKYFGQAAKNLSSLYSFCEKNDAVLFIDEAETLLSKRDSSSGESAAHATNSMRSQLLILMEKTPIISIFSTNLIDSYDDAFLSRLITVHFELPSLQTRSLIWQSHIPRDLPLERNITNVELAARYSNLNGREIARAVVEAAHKVAIENRAAVTFSDFDFAVELVHGCIPERELATV